MKYLSVILLFGLEILFAFRAYGSPLEKISCEKISLTSSMLELSLTDRSCLDFLWKMEPEMYGLYREENILKILQADALSQSNLESVLFVLRIGFYHDQIGQILKQRGVDIKITKILRGLLSRGLIALNPKNEREAILLESFLVLIDTAWIAAPFYKETRQVLVYYSKNKSLLAESSHGRALYSLLYLVQRASYKNDFSSQISRVFMGKLSFFSTLKTSDSSQNYLVHNAMWALGAIGAYVPTKAMLAAKLLKKAVLYHNGESEGYIWAVNSLARIADCHLFAGGETLCKSDLVEKRKKEVFRNVYTFAEEGLEFHTSVHATKLEDLRRSAIQVRNSFHKLTGVTSPVSDDPNQILKVYIYASKSDYEKYHSFLFNLSSANGGIYLEEIGTLFTFDREKHESVYTLDELFRHEYSHYLIGRFLVPGLWGQTELYAENRMVWFDEGFAEFLVGGLGDEHVQMRANLLKRIREDGAKDQLEIGQILNSRYDQGFTFYRYAALLIHVLHQNDPGLFTKLLTALRSSDVKTFDEITRQMKDDKKLYATFKTYVGLETVRAEI